MLVSGPETRGQRTTVVTLPHVQIPSRLASEASWLLPLLYIFRLVCRHCEHTRIVDGFTADGAALLLDSSSSSAHLCYFKEQSAPSDLHHPINHLHDSHVSVCPDWLR